MERELQKLRAENQALRQDLGIGTKAPHGFEQLTSVSQLDTIERSLPGDRLTMSRQLGVQISGDILDRFELWAEYLRSRFRPANAIPASHFESEGWYVLGACYLVPQRLQAVVRFDSFNPRRSVPGDSTTTWTMGLNCLIRGDDLKLQLDYLLVDDPGFAHRQSKIIFRAQNVF
jgi:phosphate-selective porin